MATRVEIHSLEKLIGGHVGEKIGSSLLGDLYHVVHPMLGNCVLKLFRHSVVQYPDFAENFLVPQRNLLELADPNIARIYQVESERHFFVLRELVVGVNLQEQLKVRGKLSPKDATRALWDVAMGLVTAYQLKIVCRNLKPGNLIVLPQGRLCMVDISLPPTSRAYLAPEQWKNQSSNPATDIYAAGGIYYHLLTGALPSSPDVDNIPLEGLALSTAQKIRTVLKKMLARDPAERYQNPVPLSRDLREVLHSMDIEVTKLDYSFDVTGCETANREPVSGKSSGTTMMLIERQGDGISVTRRITRPEEVDKVDFEEIFLDRQELEANPEKALAKITDIDDDMQKTETLLPRLVYFPKNFASRVVEHLQMTFRRKCWILKESDATGTGELELDTDRACVLFHFYNYEDKLIELLASSDVENDRTPDDLEMQTVDYKERREPKPMDSEDECSMQTISYSENEEPDLIELTELEDVSPVNYEDSATEFALDDSSLQTINYKLEEPDSATEFALDDSSLQTINYKLEEPGVPDITINARNPAALRAEANTGLRSTTEFLVDFANPYQVEAWTTFINEHQLKSGEHFDLEEITDDQFAIYPKNLDRYKKEQQNIARIKSFFQGDYDITELDRGGMGIVLKLTARDESTILSLRPENFWARQKYARYIRSVTDSRGNETVYAEIPEGTEFVVKVAFEDHEESLIQEARVLAMLSEDSRICHGIIGCVQHGRLFTQDEKSDQSKIGYYLMLEYASQGDMEKLFPRFPDGRLSPAVAFTVMYAMTEALQVLEKKGIIHRDLKPHNILLDADGVPKLADFGLVIAIFEESEVMTPERRRLMRILDRDFLKISHAFELAEKKLADLRALSQTREHEDLSSQIAAAQRRVNHLEKQELQKAETLKGKYRLVSAAANALQGRFAGSLYYTAPEQFDLQAVLSPKCDIYQLGCVMFTLLTGKRPVEGKNSVEVMNKMLAPDKPKVSDIIGGDPLVDAISDVIARMMHHSPEKRCTIGEVREHLERILVEHAAALKKLPYEKSRFRERDKVLERQIALACEVHEKCVRHLFDDLFRE